ncbi:MAG TPA: Maf family protein [Gemmatimonadaceae bacterium]|nr:Maf family protein [Gemmatimonadaceae bacterium]
MIQRNIEQLKVILASQSPRRRQLLELVGIHHEVRPADLDESIRSGELPEQYAERVAREKVEHVARQNGDALIVGADTIVVIDDIILGKPRDVDDAARMLRMLSGRSHTVMTAVAAAHEGRTVSGVEIVDVTFLPLDDDRISRYIATGEPMDKAGAYGIQGYGATIVRRIDGDYFAVMGLSLVRLVAVLRELGITYDFPR